MAEVCSKCHGHFPSGEFDAEEDVCLNCLFPQAAKHAITPINEDYGFKRNVTAERELLDNLEDIPEIQSESAQKSLKEFKMRNYPKKGKL